MCGCAAAPLCKGRPAAQIPAPASRHTHRHRTEAPCKQGCRFRPLKATNAARVSLSQSHAGHSPHTGLYSRPILRLATKSSWTVEASKPTQRARTGWDLAGHKEVQERPRGGWQPSHTGCRAETNAEPSEGAPRQQAAVPVRSAQMPYTSRLGCTGPAPPNARADPNRKVGEVALWVSGRPQPVGFGATPCKKTSDNSSDCPT